MSIVNEMKMVIEGRSFNEIAVENVRGHKNIPATIARATMKVMIKPNPRSVFTASRPMGITSIATSP